MSRRIAVITGIHANVPALEASLRWIAELDVDETYCRGDLVGYGPRPNEICRAVLFVNCGSVGKPKDGDVRGSFALLEDDDGDVRLSVERVAYDAQAVAAEIRDVALPRELADQLLRA